MTPVKNINIPQACHQSWQQMTPVEQGMHCQSCSKTVTDFTSMSNQQVINYLAKQSHVCGRFNDYQLNSINHQLNVQSVPAAGGWKRLVMLMGVFGSTIFYKANAQTKPTTEQAPGNKPDAGTITMGKVLLRDTATYKTITGQVVDELNMPLPGVKVMEQKDLKCTIADAYGNFKLSVPTSASQLVLTFIGYATKTVNINTKAAAVYQIKLAPQVMGEVVIVRRQSFVKRVYYRYIRKPIRSIFN
ncbi:CarboxypepD_reg-like domain-containing protein [Mucilaginibacter pineti]|uniref:CarboxypepD_reg-like domain-containing protein n=1 Tax=Mucilaginibacter pineti TaxID=1391627 RepID=A0A1G6YQT8_9SPHI|nr:carboxypeptidase-like regulatory domain-containing protein [Mucilaginibacter pineti]SDD92403.1 CarboxypepD_reg-like domain-containing protein [Mucilaginibacter pineti]